MNIDPSVSIVISFAGFAYVFMKKICPLTIKSLDDYIDSVKNKFLGAEQQWTDASQQMNDAILKKDNITAVIENDNNASRIRIEKFREDNEAHLQILAGRLEASMKAQLEAESQRLRDALLTKISDEISARIATLAESGGCTMASEYAPDDLKKLL
jgi:F0F1-type ATP synthase membrane subunit b/b'